MYTGEHLRVLLSKIFHLLARFLEVLIFNICLTRSQSGIVMLDKMTHNL